MTFKKPSEKSHRLQMSFTGVPAQSDRRGKKQWIDFKLSTAKNSKRMKKGIKYEQ
jgi:hypothetical protein